MVSAVGVELAMTHIFKYLQSVDVAKVSEVSRKSSLADCRWIARN